MLKGQRFGHLKVKYSIGRYGEGDHKWLCLCDCGNTCIVIGRLLLSGKRRSCSICSGLVTRRKHGFSGDPAYRTWGKIMDRCNNPRNADYADYGGRGIKVCDEWHNAANFCKWAIENGFEQGLTIERIDNDGNYEPGNCTWIPNEQQARNRRSNKPITINGKTKLIVEWAEESNLNYEALRYRIDAGWPEHELLVPSNSLPRRRKNGKREADCNRSATA